MNRKSFVLPWKTASLFCIRFTRCFSAPTHLNWTSSKPNLSLLHRASELEITAGAKRVKIKLERDPSKREYSFHTTKGSPGITARARGIKLQPRCLQGEREGALPLQPGLRGHEKEASPFVRPSEAPRRALEIPRRSAACSRARAGSRLDVVSFYFFFPLPRGSPPPATSGPEPSSFLLGDCGEPRRCRCGRCSRTRETMTAAAAAAAPNRE